VYQPEACRSEPLLCVSSVALLLTPSCRHTPRLGSGAFMAFTMRYQVILLPLGSSAWPQGMSCICGNGAGAARCLYDARSRLISCAWCRHRGSPWRTRARGLSRSNVTDLTQAIVSATNQVEHSKPRGRS